MKSEADFGCAVAYACAVTFTPLHRSLGLPPSTLTDEILDAAVAAGVAETDDLDWKSELPPVKGIPQGRAPAGGTPRSATSIAASR